VDALRQLAVIFDVDSGKAKEGVKQLGTAVDGVVGRLGGLVEAFVGSAFVGGLKSFVEGQIDAARAVRLTSQKLGVGVEDLEQFQFAAGAAGVSAEGAATGLKFLNKSMGLALEGNQEAVQTFQALGVAIKDGHGNVRQLGDVIPEVADAFAKMGSQQERTAASMKIFGRQGADLLPLLDGGSEGLQKMYARFHELGGGMDENFISKAKDAGRALSGMRFGFDVIKREIAVQFFPVVQAFGERMQRVGAYINGFVKETNIAKEVAVLLGGAAAAAGLKAAFGWAKFLGLFKAGNAGLFKSLISMGWLGIAIAGVVALALAFEDLWVGINDGESLIRGWLEKANGVAETDQLFKQLKATWDSIEVSLDSMKPAIASVASAFGEIALSPYFIASLEFVVRLVGSLVSGLIGAVRVAGNLTAFAANTLGGKLTDADKNLDNAGKAVDQTGDSIFGKNGFFGDAAFTLPTAPGAPAFVGPSYQDPSSKDYQGGNNTVTIGEITVVGGTTNAETGEAVAGAIRTTFEDEKRNANAAFKRGPVK
jgi:hypothetical protein